MPDRRMTHSAPWPTDLEDLVLRARHWQGWEFALADSEWDDGAVTGLRLLITVRGKDAYHPDRRRGTTFLFPVPATTYDRRSWEDWIWDRCMDVNKHETGEGLSFVYQRRTDTGDALEVAEHPFAPFHGPGREPCRNTRVGVDPMEVRVTQGGGRYSGLWWDGAYVHTDDQHAGCIHWARCTPVQLVDQ